MDIMSLLMAKRAGGNTPSGGGSVNSVNGVKPDGAGNVALKYDDLKDRPFGIASLETKVILPTTEVTGLTNEENGMVFNYYFGVIDVPENSVLRNEDVTLIVNEFISYDVVFDGVTYKDVLCREYELGDAGGWDENGNVMWGELPFVISGGNGAYYLGAKDYAESHTVSIIAHKEHIDTLEEKYMPSVLKNRLVYMDMNSDVQTFWENASITVPNGACMVCANGSFSFDTEVSYLSIPNSVTSINVALNKPTNTCSVTWVYEIIGVTYIEGQGENYVIRCDINLGQPGASVDTFSHNQVFYRSVHDNTWARFYVNGGSSSSNIREHGVLNSGYAYAYLEETQEMVKFYP